MAKKATPPADNLSNLTFEQALQQLEGVVQALEQGDLPLERSIELSAFGQRLAAHCNAQLSMAELKVQQLKPDSVQDE